MAESEMSGKGTARVSVRVRGRSRDATSATEAAAASRHEKRRERLADMQHRPRQSSLSLCLCPSSFCLAMLALVCLFRYLSPSLLLLRIFVPFCQSCTCNSPFHQETNQTKRNIIILSLPFPRPGMMIESCCLCCCSSSPRCSGAGYFGASLSRSLCLCVSGEVD